MTAAEGALGAAELLADADRPGGWLLLVDRVRQSYVDLDDPTYIDFEYMQVFADVLETVFTAAPGPLAVTHVGGGACSFARYLAATRPGSSQIVLEPDTALTTLVRGRLPFARNARIRVRPVDGRTGVRALRDASADLLVLDAFQGGRVPAELSTAEFFADAARVLRPDGLLLANVADGPPLDYTARVLAGVRTALPHAVVIADPAVLKRRRYGNIVVVASRAALPVDALRRSAARAAFPRSVTLGPGGATRRPFTDSAAQRSPAPPEDSWRVAEWNDEWEAENPA